jgi:hypothetical protein
MQAGGGIISVNRVGPHRSLPSSTFPILNLLLDRLGHGLKREPPAAPKEDVMDEDGKSLPGELIGEGGAFVEFRADSRNCFRRRFFPIRYFLFSEELKTVVSMQSQDAGQGLIASLRP